MFDLPPLKHGDIYESQMWKACRAVFKAIEKGLREDGYVSIIGFGRFHVITRKAYRQLVHEGGGDKYVSYWRMTPERKHVVFRPSNSLKKLVNQGVVDSESQAS